MKQLNYLSAIAATLLLSACGGDGHISPPAPALPACQQVTVPEKPVELICYKDIWCGVSVPIKNAISISVGSHAAWQQFDYDSVAGNFTMVGTPTFTYAAIIYADIRGRCGDSYTQVPIIFLQVRP